MARPTPSTEAARARAAGLAALLALAGCVDPFPPGTVPVDAAGGPGADRGFYPGHRPPLDLGPADGAPVDATPGPADLRPTDREPPEDDDPDAAPRRDAAPPPPDRGPAGRDAEVPPPLDAAPPCRADELACDGIDEDCDGRVDEIPGLCAPVIARQCELWLGFATAAASPPADAAEWGLCPGVPRDGLGDVRCVSSGGDGRFHTVRLPARGPGFVPGDRLGVRLTCAPGPVGDWVARHCEVALALRQGHGDPQPKDVPPGDCPLDGVGPQRPPIRCVRSGGDGRFHRLSAAEDVTHDTRIAAAFFCTDAADPARAAAAVQRLEVFVGTARRDLDGDECDDPDEPVRDTWGDCPEEPEEPHGRSRCASSPGGAGFASLRPDRGLGPCDLMSLALRPAPDDR